MNKPEDQSPSVVRPGSNFEVELQAMPIHGHAVFRALRTAANDLPRRISLMPVGGSITYGTGSTDGNGYRQHLLQILAKENYQARMLGSRRAGSMVNNENEGWRGYRIDQITNKAQPSAATCQPDIFLVNTGSNDCVQGFEIAQAGTRVRHLLEVLWDACPHSAIALSTLLPNRDVETESRVLELNAQIREIAKRIPSDRKITLVDFHVPDGPQVDDLPDGTHPNYAGYRKMALLWYKGLQDVL